MIFYLALERKEITQLSCGVRGFCSALLCICEDTTFFFSRDKRKNYHWFGWVFGLSLRVTSGGNFLHIQGFD